MNSLEQILQKIEAEGNKKAESILSNAQKEREEIISSKEKETKLKTEEILKNAKTKADIILKNAYDFEITEEKNGILKAKAKIFEDWISKAASTLDTQESEEYFKILEKLILKYCDKEKNGEIVFSKKDKENLPKDFLEKINNNLSLKSISLSFSKDCAKIKNGFILRYGPIEENCSFKALFEDKKEEIRDTLTALLKDNKEG